jgi:transcription elongation factor Elf1
MVGACPRCEKDAGVEIGETLLKIGKTREQPVSIASCGNCGLIFYEKINKIKDF